MASIKNRNFGLDIIRFFAIWLVLFQHGGFPLISDLQGLKIGGFGVEIFFVLSGYLIGGILIKTLEKENSFRSIWSFWVKRWFRILPVYYLILAIKFFFIDNSIGTNIFYYVFFLQNNFYGISYYGVTWSLVVEEWFYILAPIFIFTVFKVFNSNTNRIYSFVAFLFFILTLRFLYVYNYDVPYSGVNGNVPFRLDSLFIGVLLMYIKLKFEVLYTFISQWWVFVTSLLILIGYLFFIASLPSKGSSIDELMFTRTIGFTFVSFFAALIIPYCETSIKINRSTKASKLVYGFITYTSLFTYAIYLIHPLVFSYFLHSHSFTISKEVNFGLAMLVTYVLAAVVYYGYESKWLRLRDKLYAKP